LKLDKEIDIFGAVFRADSSLATSRDEHQQIYSATAVCGVTTHAKVSGHIRYHRIQAGIGL
jgi:hypothetical protein